MGFRQTRYRIEDGKVRKNIFDSDLEMGDGWALDVESAKAITNKPPEPKKKQPKKATSEGLTV